MTRKPPSLSARCQALLADLSLEEKVDLVTGRDMWHTRPIERLEIPAMKVTDGPNGARGDGLMGTGTPTACVPSGSALGATWDPALVERIGGLLGDEARAKGAHVLLAPTINLHRSPLGGRNFECYSEDPLLSGELATAFVRGVQSRGVATTPKHFVANDSEFERNTIDSQVDERTLREVYLVPFEKAVKEGGAWGVMSAYNRLNGRFCSEHEWLLGHVLREEWGFDGFVVSDWFALRSTQDSARAGLSLEMPGEGQWYGPKLLEAVKSGEVSQAELDAIAGDLLGVLERTGVLDGEGRDTEGTLDRDEDRALIREAAAAGTVLLRNDGVLPLETEGLSSVAVIGPNALKGRVMGGGSAKVAAYRAVSPLRALESRLPDGVDVRYARGCTIDRSTTPLSAPLLAGSAHVEYFAGHDHAGDVLASREVDELSWTAIGPPAPGVPADAFSMRAVATVRPSATGSHELRMIQCGRARVLVDGAVVIDATEGEIRRGEAFFGFGSEELTAELALEAGCEIELCIEFSNRDSMILSGATLGLVPLVAEDLVGEAEALAAECDAAIVVVGTNDDWETEGRDRDLFELPGEQPELIRRVAAANPRTIVVVNAGAPHALDWIEAPAATLLLGFAGQELGDALVDVLLGEAEPGGRAPTTVPAHPQQFAASANYPGENGAVRYGEGVLTGHRWNDALAIAPAVPFGHGLSYTQFRIGSPEAPATLVAGGPLRLEVDLANEGDRTGSEVVQVYVEPVAPRLPRPIRELKGFAKVSLAPGEATRVTIELPPRAFAYYDIGDSTLADLQSGMPVPAEGGHARREEAGWYVDPGEYRIFVGRSSAELGEAHVLEITGDEAKLPS
ncbi:MAG: glycoside hydrolase family 3 C-terminal domain-containing protein [Deltaproteobacteria bacterium]|nr:glycoside hydrolase family 3 C-terminal domain-containing protein [Deltaproteobacteria bacterium]